MSNRRLHTLSVSLPGCLSRQPKRGRPSLAWRSHRYFKERTLLKPIRLIIADDHIIVRESVVALLADEPDLEVVGQAGTGREALVLARQHRPDLALIDITMRDMNGLEATRRCKSEFPGLNIIILTMHEEQVFFSEALRAGAAGYVLKGSPSEELFSAIWVVQAGGLYAPPQLAGHA